MPKKRRLTELYVVGQEVIFDDGEGEPITVYVRKLNPVDHDTALRRANAARSRIMAIKSDEDTEEYLAMMSLVYDYKDDDLVQYLVDDYRGTKYVSIEARRADDDEWAKDNYLQGLHDAWDDGVDATYAEDPTDADALRVYKELERFSALVEQDVEAEVGDFRETLSDRSVGDLRAMVLEKIFDVRASIAWLDEYRKCEIWLSVRESDHKTRYFTGGRQEIDELPTEVFKRLQDAYRLISVDPLEGKDSAATPASSPSSEQQDEPATEGSSGPKGAAA